MGALDTIEFQPGAQNPMARPAADTRPDPGFLETAGASFRLTKDDSPATDIRHRSDSYMEIYDALPDDSKQRLVRQRLSRPELSRQRIPEAEWFNTAIWAEADRLRASDPKMYASLPKTREEYEASILDRAKRERARDRDITSRGGGIANLAGGIGGSFFDPINVGSMFISGGSSGIARTMAREAAINSGVEALEIPFVSAQRKKYGEDYTAEEAGFNVLVAGLAGAGFAGAAKGAEIGIPKLINVVAGLQPLDKRLAKALSADVKGAVVSPAQIQIAAARAFDAGDDAELAGAIRAINPEGMPPETADAVHVLERQADVDASTPFKRTYAGDDAHQAALTETLTRIVNDLPPGSGPARSLRGGRSAQEQFMSHVRRAESSGNDAAVPRDAQGNLLSSAVGRYQFTKRTWLTYYGRAFGKTGETEAQILAKRTDGGLQDRLMGMLTADNARALGRAGEPETAGNLYLAHFLGPGDAVKVIKAGEGVTARDILPAETIAANRFLENMTADDVVAWAHRKMGEPTLDRGSRPIVRADEFGDDTESLYLAQRDADEATLRRLALEREGQDAASIQLGNDVPEAARPVDVPDIENIDLTPVEHDADVGATVAHEPQEWPQIVEQLRNAKGGEVEGALYHPATGPIDVIWGAVGRTEKDGHGLAKIIAKHPEVVDELPRILPAMRVRSETPNRIILESADHKAAVSLEWYGAKKTWLLSAYKKEKTPAAAVYSRADALDQDGSPDLGAAQHIPQSGENINTAPSNVKGGDLPTDTRVSGDDPSARAALQRFDDPSGAAVAKAVESMTHDATMIDPNTVVRLNDQSGEVTVGDVLRSFDAEDAEIAEIRGCMAPPKMEGDV